ncbi:MAG TPA: hypothetical protein VFY10_08865, partial [Dehalococcoidia bacterium]|nr:hypothetical protein [Dehalococcoidia bacterium]
MTTETPASDQAPAPAEQGEAQKPVEIRPPAPASKPTKVLPTNRIAFPKQLDILRAFDAASGPPMHRPVSLADVAKIADLASQTLSLPNGFFIDVGLVRKVEGGF